MLRLRTTTAAVGANLDGTARSDARRTRRSSGPAGERLPEARQAKTDPDRRLFGVVRAVAKFDVVQGPPTKKAAGATL